MKRIPRRSRVAPLALLLLAVFACSERAPTLRVLAAASLGDVLEPLAAGFEGAPVEPSFGASSTLARQIRDGAPADVFLSASAEWMEMLAEAGALAGQPIVFARNRLVCVAPAASGPALRDVRGPGALLGALAPGDRVAIADPGVPAGEYARRALARAGLLEAYAPRLVGQKDVRAVLNAVERGELRAGFVYATDAAVAEVAVLFELGRADRDRVEYQAAALRAAQSPDQARLFLAHLQSEPARVVLTRAGFSRP